MYIAKAMRRVFSIDCQECGEVKVLFWVGRCSFCDEGEGKVATE